MSRFYAAFVVMHPFTIRSRIGNQEESPMPNSARIVTKGITILFTAAFLWSSASAARAQSGTHTLNCGPQKTIGEAIRTLKPGDTLLVSGTCNENVEIGEEVHRITLDGQGTATVNGDSSANAISVRGTGITIRGFVITGGAPQGIAVTDGGSAVIDGNTIQNADRNGITVFRNSSADIINNTIQNNPLAGIAIQSNSSARVGWIGPPNNRISAPNLIQNNGAQGIQVYRGSSAQIFSNTIQNNGSHGVIVDRNAQAEIAACTITGNVGDGIRGMRNAGLDIGTDATGATPQFDDDTNTGTNGGFGVRCLIDGFVHGRLGTLTGTAGGKSFGESCTDSVVP
jgi:parallel beta-helix repeat protein